MPWDCGSPDDRSYTIDIEKYVATTPRRTQTNLYSWLRFIVSYPRNDGDGENIPLATIQPASTPYSKSNSSTCEREDAGFAEGAGVDAQPLVLKICFEDGIYTKQLDYSTFARWEHVKALLDRFEVEGVGESASITHVWDMHNDKGICSGDWEARVHPGMAIGLGWREMDMRGCDSDISSDDEQDERRSVDGQQWWFGAWKRNVEQEGKRSGRAQREPSRRMVLFGVLAMATFLGVVVLFCSVM